MSFFSTPVSSATAVGPTAAAPAATRAPRAAATAAAPSSSVTVDTMPASPPAEVLDAIGVAARAADRLAASGRRLQFSVDPPTGRVAVQVIDHPGTVLGTLTGAQALAVAGGEPLA